MNYLDEIVQNDMNRIDCKDLYSSISFDSKIMITGCNGMIATYLIYYFLYLNDTYHYNLTIYAITRNREKTEYKFQDIWKRNDIIFIEHDVNNPFQFEFSIDYLFHLASSADPKNILENPVDIIKANTIGLMNALEYARKKAIKRIIFSSTREVYGKMDNNCEEVNEESLGILDQMGVRACYPESKKMSECIIHSYYLQYNIPYTILRIAHSYGPGMPIKDDGRIMSDFINNVVNSEDIMLKSDGSAIRGFIYLSDMISGMLYATFVGEQNQIYNLANENENISILDLAKLLLSLFPEKNLSLKYKKLSNKEKEAYCKFKRVKMNTDKLQKLGWKPYVSLKDGLYQTVKSFNQ